MKKFTILMILMLSAVLVYAGTSVSANDIIRQINSGKEVVYKDANDQG